MGIMARMVILADHVWQGTCACAASATTRKIMDIRSLEHAPRLVTRAELAWSVGLKGQGLHLGPAGRLLPSQPLRPVR